jgi:3-oxoadipyl-CoA thiolase
MDVFVCDPVRTPIGRYGGVLAHVRADNLGASSIRALIERHPSIREAIDEVYLGCANQAGEDNRNVARMAALLAGLPDEVPGVTLNRLCASGLDAVGVASRAIRAGEIELAIAGGVESMSRAPFVMGKAAEAFQRDAEVFDTTIGWRFINPIFKQQYGVDSMPETAENVALEFHVSRADQDAFAMRSQQRAAAAISDGRFADTMIAIDVPGGKAGTVRVERDEHPRPNTTLDALAKLRPIVRDGGTITAGNASGVSDGAAAMLLASSAAIRRHGLRPLARVLGMASAGVPPRIMGIGPVPAIRAVLERAGLGLGEIDLFEINEAFAAQYVACEKLLGLDRARVNVNGGAIALGHPLGATGTRLVLTLLLELRRRGGRFGIASACIGGGQGIALLLEAERSAA